MAAYSTKLMKLAFFDFGMVWVWEKSSKRIGEHGDRGGERDAMLA